MGNKFFEVFINNVPTGLITGVSINANGCIIATQVGEPTISGVANPFQPKPIWTPCEQKQIILSGTYFLKEYLGDTSKFI